MSTLKNDFDRDELNRWWSHQNICWWCDQWHADCFHHIVGRLGSETRSILNAAPLSNHYCHLPIHGRLRKKEHIKRLLQRTLRYLLSQGYKLDPERDGPFLKKYERYYRD